MTSCSADACRGALSAVAATRAVIGVGPVGVSVRQNEPDSTPMSTVAVHIAPGGVVVCADTLHLAMDADGRLARGEIDKAVVTERFALGFAGAVSITIPGDGSGHNRLDLRGLLVEFAARSTGVRTFVEELVVGASTILLPFLDHAGAQLAVESSKEAVEVMSVVVVDRITNEYCVARMRSDGTVPYQVDRVRRDRREAATIVLGYDPGHVAPDSADLGALRDHGVGVVRRAVRTAPKLNGVPTVGGRIRWWCCAGPRVATGNLEL